MVIDNSIPAERLLSYSVNLLRKAHAGIKHLVHADPEVTLARLYDPAKEVHNQPLRVDHFAEDYYRMGLNKEFGPRVLAVGEESLEHTAAFADITERKEVFAIMDIIDGTDLLLRRLGNWCSAVVFYYPPKRQILMSLVADHEGNIFYAIDGISEAYFYSAQQRSLAEAVPLSKRTRPQDREDAFGRQVRRRPSGPSTIATLRDASVCFVGQKPQHFLATARNTTFCDQLDHFVEMLGRQERPAPEFRIYNLGGIPMICKVANGTIDAVFSLNKSKPHDVVAGAYIALKAGAFVGDIKGQAISEAEMAEWLNHPEERCNPCIVSATPELYQEMVVALGSAV